MTPAGERFDAFSTTAEEQWIAGQGPQPLTAADRLPARAGVLTPRAGAGHAWVGTLRTARLWVDGDRRLLFRDREGSTRCLVPADRVHGCWWVAAAAVTAVGLPPAPTGWLVLVGSTGPLLALRLSDWEPPLLPPDRPETLRAAGIEGLARALGADLEAVADAEEAARRIGSVPAGLVHTLDGPPPRVFSAAALGTPLLVLVAYWLLLWLLPATTATALAAVALCGLAIGLDVVPWVERRRRTHALPEGLDQWWGAQPSGRDRRGAGIGTVAGPAGAEVVLADGFGFEAWLPGPALGGAASLVVNRDDAGQPWSLVLHDRDQRILAPFAVRDWLGRPGAEQSLADAAAGMGMVLSEATREPWQLPTGRQLSRRTSATTDVLGNLAATIVSAVVTPLFWMSASLAGHRDAAQVWWVIGGALLALRLALRWRRVL